MVKDDTHDKHKSKFVLIKKASECTNYNVDRCDENLENSEIRNIESHDENSEISNQEINTHDGVFTWTAGQFNNDVLNLLDKGKNFVIAPRINDVKMAAKIGLERLVYGLRWANPYWDAKRTEPRVYHPIKSNVTRFFNTTDARAAPYGVRPTELLVKKLKNVVNLEIEKLDQKSIKSNIHKSEIKAIKDLKNNPNIVVTTTDKTNKLAPIDKSYMEAKSRELMDESRFQKLNGDPSNKIQKEANKLLQKVILPDSEVPDCYWNNFNIKHSQSPALYTLVKDHKETFPNCKPRPVAPIKYSALENLDITINKILTQFNPFLKYRIFNTKAIIEKLNNIKSIKPHQFIFSLDIKEMFPTLPTDESALLAIKSFLEKHISKVNLYGFKLGHIMEMIKFIFENNYIRNGEEYFLQLIGLGTGSHSSLNIGDIMVDYIYGEAIINYQKEPEGLCLYVDDSWGIWDGTMDEFDQFIIALNEVFGNRVIFIPDLGTKIDGNTVINFLDLTITACSTGTLDYEFFQKPTASGRYLNFMSHNPMKTKINIIKTEANRRLENCKDINKAYKHLDSLKDQLLKCQYPKILIEEHITKVIRAHLIKNKPTNNKKQYDYIFRVPYVNECYTRTMKKHIRDLDINARVVEGSGFKLISLLKGKDRAPCNCKICHLGINCQERNFVYQATCNLCNGIYIGASSRPAKERLGEYESSVRLDSQTDRTTLAKHNFNSHDKVHNDISKCFKFKIIDKGSDSVNTFIKEAIHIKDKHPDINENQENGFIK